MHFYFLNFKANVLNVFLTFLEYINIQSLTEDFIGFYTFGVDTVIFLIFIIYT